MKTTKLFGALLLVLASCNQFEERKERVVAKFCAKMVRCGQDVYTLTMEKCMTAKEKFKTETELAEIEDFTEVATCNDMILTVLRAKGAQ